MLVANGAHWGFDPPWLTNRELNLRNMPVWILIAPLSALTNSQLLLAQSLL